MLKLYLNGTRRPHSFDFSIKRAIMLSMDIRAYAKLNLFLDVAGRRADGYHELVMLMQTVDVFDTVHIELSDGISASAKGVAGDNIAARAASAFYDAAGIRGGARIAIEKRIPIEAGMGGGSADAAAVLKGLNALHGYPLDGKAMALTAQGLGADVPFALMTGTAVARGIGELLEPAENRISLPYLIVKPAGGVSTPAAFSLCDRMEKRGGGDISRCVQALAAGDANAFCESTYNALTAPAISLCPDIGRAIELLREKEGCIGAFMTGSGSAVAAIFENEALADAAAKEASTGIKGARTFIAHNIQKEG